MEGEEAEWSWKATIGFEIRVLKNYAGAIPRYLATKTRITAVI